MPHLICLIFLLACLPCAGGQPSPSKIRALYNSLDTASIAEHLAFYQLYPDTREGKLSLEHAWLLMTGTKQNIHMPVASLTAGVDGLISLVNKPPDSAGLLLSEADLQIMEKAAARLPHRKLKGHSAQNEEEVLALNPADIDLARGLLLSQLESSPDQMKKIRSYEASLDMMALQILARLVETTPEAKIRAINSFIFDEMGFRFPPHSLYAKDIDLYTFLPSVLDSRRGVCLGVSILYICLAQRLGLQLEMVTPPGHIYVRYRSRETAINIETTARGIHLDSSDYLGINTRALQERTIKEVIGLAHFNQAGVYWHKQDFDKAIAAYLKALPYLPNDKLLQELLAYNYLLKGERETGEKLLKGVANHLPDYAISKQVIAEDYLLGHVDAKGIQTTFKEVDDTRDSILEKRKALEKVLEGYPRFRSGLLHLAITWLQLHREGEALEILERYHALDPNDPTVEYYLAELYLERFDSHKAWKHLKIAEKLCENRQHAPKALKSLRREISARCPE